MASIEIIIGPMFSGKTTELLRRCSRYESVGKKVLVVNHELDTRCAVDQIATHADQKHSATKVSKLSELVLNIIPDVIAIDEAQFFDDLVWFIQTNELCKCKIIIAGLDGDYLRRPFGQVIHCIPYANSITKLDAMCSMCCDGTPASFTKKIDMNDTSIICVGSGEKFVSVCRMHYACPRPLVSRS